MLGQPASSHTVCRPSRRARLVSSVYAGPSRALVLIHDGFFSIGVWLLRTSTRSNFRPSGATVTTLRLRPARTCQRSRTPLSGTEKLDSPPRRVTRGDGRLPWAFSGEEDHPFWCEERRRSATSRALGVT